MIIPKIFSVPANLFLPPAAAAASTSSAFQAPMMLRPEQLLRALVVAKGAQSTLLEIGTERFQAQSSRSLQVGQVLELRLLSTGGRLEALVLNNDLQDRLAKRLPLLTRPFDWSGLMQRLQQPLPVQPQRPVDVQLLQQLQQLLDPAGRELAPLGGRIEQLAGQLRSSVAPLAAPSQGSLLPPSYTQALTVAAAEVRPPVFSAEQTQQLQQLWGRVQQQLTLLVEQGERSVSRNWQNATATLLQEVRQRLDTPVATLLRSPAWLEVLGRLQQHPQTPPSVAMEAGQLLAQLRHGSAPPELRGQPPVHPQTHPQTQPQATALLTSSPGVTTAPAEEVQQLQQLLGRVQQQPVEGRIPAASVPLTLLPSAAPSPDKGVTPELREQLASLQQLSQELKAVLPPPGQNAVDTPRALPPALLGRIEGLLEVLNQHQQREGTPLVLQQALQLVSAQLQQLATSPMIPARGEVLGLLSQFFGLHLERELLYDKQKTALNNLKQSLLNLRQVLGDEVREPLGRIELFQLCKARFAEMQMQFLPLPFTDLDEGYLLADRRDADEENDQNSEKPVQISMSLRLSALGNMRVDLQFDEQQGLVMKLACEDRLKMEYVKAAGDELSAALSAVKLKEIHYSADALHPVQQLQQRLMPRHSPLFDTRA